jgi:signal transduction histidine kinase
VTTAPVHGGRAFDLLLAVGCLAATLVVNLGGSESVAANRDPDVLTVALTTVAVGSIALRRRYPVAVLLLTLGGVLGLVLVKGTVGIATIGPFIATYTAVATGPSRNVRRAVGIVGLALFLGWLLDPVDLSPEGAVSNTAVFAAMIVLGTGARARREGSEAALEAAEHRVALERERAEGERERAARTATQERLRITRELHDVLGHAMSVMVVQAGAAGRLLDTDDLARAREAVAEIEHTGRRSMTEMRHLLGILRDGEPDSGESPRAPAPTLEDVGALVGRVSESGLATSVTVRGTRGDVPSGVDLAAYRIVQEALTNCLKHAGATTASVRVDYRPDDIEVEVVDDGRGASGRDAAAPSGTGHGVAGMRERVAMYGGRLVIGDRPDGGFGVCATFPLVASP